LMEPEEASAYQPKVVILSDQNRQAKVK